MPDTIKQCTETKLCRTSSVTLIINSKIAKKINSWTILEEVGRNKWRHRVYLIRCECGNEYKREYSQIKRYQCCVDCYHKRKTKYRYVPGQVVQFWTVLYKTNLIENRYRCRCKCDREAIVRGADLNSGKTTQCRSCSNSASASAKAFKHGLIRSVEYRTWAAMKQRCNNPNNTAYKYYGGKGVRVCERWDEFLKFLEDMGLRPAGDYSIDRIDSNGSYSKENCRWITCAENTRRMNLSK